MTQFNFIDVGSRGVLHRRWKQEYIKNIITFDPSDKTGDKTKTIFSEDRFHYNSAVFDIPGERVFYVCRKYRVSSLFEPDLEVLKKTCYIKGIKYFDIIRTEKVKCVRLDSILSKMEIKFDFLKVDAQGADLFVLKSAGKYLDDFKVIEIEGNLLSIYKDAPLFGEINTFLKDNNFSLLKTIYSAKDKKLVWNDYLYINNNIDEETKQFLRRVYKNE